MEPRWMSMVSKFTLEAGYDVGTSRTRLS